MTLTPQKIWFDEDFLWVKLSDARVIGAPLAWFPRLLNASPEQQKNWQLIGAGEGIHWPDIDEDISIRSLLGLPD